MATERGLHHASLQDLNEYLRTEWDYATNLTALNTVFSDDDKQYILGLSIVAPKKLYTTEKPVIFKKHHWRFLLKTM